MMEKLFKSLGISKVNNGGKFKYYSLDEIERQIQHKLSGSHRDFLEFFKDSVYFEKKPRFNFDDGSFAALLCICGLESSDDGLLHNFNQYNEHDFFSTELVPMGLATGGNLFCLRRNSDKIYFWRHDEPVVDFDPILIADNFIEFLEGFVSDSTISDDESIISSRFDF